jgi:hypothetical protein
LTLEQEGYSHNSGLVQTLVGHANWGRAIICGYLAALQERQVLWNLMNNATLEEDSTNSQTSTCMEKFDYGVHCLVSDELPFVIPLGDYTSHLTYWISANMTDRWIGNSRFTHQV